MTKWDDNPVSIAHFAESAVRAYKIAMTPPMGPVALVVDDHMQDEQVPVDLRVPRVAVPHAAGGRLGRRGARSAKLLVAAENPVIIASRARAHARRAEALVELAETLQAGVVDRHRRMNFPTRHPLRGGAPAQADVVLALEHGDISNVVAPGAAAQREGASASPSTHLFQRSNYQDVHALRRGRLAIAADAEATLPALIEEIKRQTSDAPPRGVPAARREDRRGEPQHVRARAAPKRPTAGTRARSAPRGSRWSSGRSSRTRTGRTSRAG